MKKVEFLNFLLDLALTDDLPLSFSSLFQVVVADICASLTVTKV